MQQPNLFPTFPVLDRATRTIDADITANRHGGNSESVKAHKRISSIKSSTRQKIYEYALSRGLVGVTTDEVAEQFETSPNAVSGRLTELKALGLLVKTEICRKTQSGCSARVFRATNQQV
jgi:hypothetical protein